jgi:hypothetical protein
VIDIVSVGSDLVVYDAQTSKAANVLSVQLGSLEYAPTFGIDIKFFLDPDFQFQNESFKSYLIQRLAENQINVSQVLDELFQLFEKYTFYVGDADRNTGGFIR